MFGTLSRWAKSPVVTLWRGWRQSVGRNAQSIGMLEAQHDGYQVSLVFHLLRETRFSRLSTGLSKP